jgi:putative PIN family toxin of toxin-antitoxin system
MLVVVDTNVLVSALINPAGVPARVVDEIRARTLRPAVTRQVLDEYREVLARARSGFSPAHVNSLLDDLAALALNLQVTHLDTAKLPDPDDAPFIAVALAAACPIVTGNGRHFPPECGVEILNPAQCLSRLFTE